ncbi:MAG: hypothetical protein AB7V50_03995 [Vampirovibrionia bacterium]
MFKFFQIVIVFSMFLALNIPAFAGDNIPSDLEVMYAKNVYLLMTQFDKKEALFAQNAENHSIQNNSQMRLVFKDKFNYTKECYLKLKEQQPTSKFVSIHQSLLSGLYKTLQYIQVVIAELDKNKNVNDIAKANSKVFQDANGTYSAAVKEFVTLVRSWQRPYINKVMPSKTTGESQ